MGGPSCLYVKSCSSAERDFQHEQPMPRAEARGSLLLPHPDNYYIKIECHRDRFLSCLLYIPIPHKPCRATVTLDFSRILDASMKVVHRIPRQSHFQERRMAQ